MELKLKKIDELYDVSPLLIAPLMELKRKNEFYSGRACGTFNRTAYGIETHKQRNHKHTPTTFNRTAYGIETGLLKWLPRCSWLLIAPLMELKHFHSRYKTS